jgi:photosystem II stability/assembly factor-like uncharacterized protein
MTANHLLYVGTIGEGIWCSSDGGQSFVRSGEGLFVECHVRALAVHPRDPRILYLGTEQGLYRSPDGADHWRPCPAPVAGQQIWSILLLPSDPNVVLIGACPSRLFRSEDGGKSWTEPAVHMQQDCPRIIHTRVTTLQADPDEAQTVWAGVEIDGLYRSPDAGRTWQPVGHGLSSRDIHALAVVPANGRGKRWLASTNNDLNVSTDRGETWQPQRLAQTLPLPYFRGLAQKCGQPEVVFLGNGDAPPGTTGLIARSTDGGQSWQPAQMPGRANSTIWGFAVNPADPNLVYSYSVSGQVYRSRDAGASWEKLPREFGEIRALAWAPK